MWVADVIDHTGNYPGQERLILLAEACDAEVEVRSECLVVFWWGSDFVASCG